MRQSSSLAFDAAPRRRLVLCALLAAHSVTAADWSFRDFLAGDWDLERKAAGVHHGHATVMMLILCGLPPLLLMLILCWCGHCC